MLLAYSLPKETVGAIMLLYKNTKVKIRFPARDRDHFDIVGSILQGDSLVPYPFIICLDYVFRTSIDIIKYNRFKLAKEWSRKYITQRITDEYYNDEIALLTNTLTQAETLLYSLERQQLA